MRLLFISTRINSLRTRVSNTFSLPERFKGTVVEKWATYWRGLVADYTEVATGVVKEAYAKPRKAAILGGAAYALYSACERNPNEEDFMESLRYWSNQLVIIPPAQQNPESARYILQLEQAVNHQTLRLLSLGFCTILWIDLYDKDDCTYPAICEYTQVDYTNFHEHVVDIGFWNQFWRLRWKMRNFDINYL